MDRPVETWELALGVDLEAPGADGAPLFLRIARALADDIRRGRLRVGTRLPGSRTLAARLGVHRNTVLAAYRELLVEGWIEARGGQGTFVSSALPEPRPRRTRGAPRVTARPSMGFTLAGPVPLPPPHQDVPPGALPLLAGLPDLRLVPKAALARAYRRTLRRREDVLGYTDPRGSARLRRALAEMLRASRGLAIDADDVVVTRGSQMALALSARALLAPGDVVAVEAWGYRPAWHALRDAGAELVPVPVDGSGLDVDALARLCDERPVRAVYLTPHHQYPTTVSLSAGRRLALLALAASKRIALLEDDYDHEFHYEGHPPMPLASADEGGVVIHVGTLSKVLAPGLRIGYLAAPRPLLERVAAMRTYVDRQGDQVTEGAVAELIEDGELVRHLRRARRRYHARRDLFVEALRAAFGESLSFRVPNGGMGLWARVRPKVDVERWQARAREEGVVFQPGRLFAFDGRAKPFVRLGYGALDEREIPEAVRRLRRALPSRARG